MITAPGVGTRGEQGADQGREQTGGAQTGDAQTGATERGAQDPDAKQPFGKHGDARADWITIERVAAR